MSKTLLVVEDDQMLQNLMVIYFKKAGFHVVTASTGKEAIDVFQQESPCFVILDLMLPEMSGEEVCKYIRETCQSDVPVKTKDEVGELTEQFNGFIQKIKRSEELRNQMTADLAHEVRTPLSNITGYLEALKNGVIEPDRELLTSLHGEAERLKKMIEQLYHLSEREWNHHLNEKPGRPLNVKVMVEKMLPLNAMELQKQAVEVETFVEEAYLCISEDMMKQVIGNLLDNAIRYSVEDTVIKIKGKNLHASYVLEIAGKGQPIPLGSTSRLYDRFYRVDPSRSRQSGGNGLGLAIVKELVERQQGKVWLETDGTYHQFFIELPMVSQADK